MSDQDRMVLNELTRKVQQQEKTISQLVKIIAATNRRVSDAASKKDEIQHDYTFHK
ncbi:putative coiled-coil protein SlyX [Virgibacillus natechei]|uniref:Coiled-coil protein SlyX n=1 Tax=Virgibacillus natechei TaxID=1216297 RepID=A0ABS4IJQ7_9BACI|nr:hypothetical protein [Virgibacillus natechei]MBP1971157.1 putative coiled-coil protein SlyX [Virgibacillus natechei]UZD11904.1 hypothetical protein OLD84_13260 [Virgibacillus natechei]